MVTGLNACDAPLALTRRCLAAAKATQHHRRELGGAEPR